MPEFPKLWGWPKSKARKANATVGTVPKTTAATTSTESTAPADASGITDAAALEQTSELFSTEGSYGVKVVAEPPDATLDIVFVHGLTGNRETTWTHKNKFFWPRQLAEDIKNARIMTFGYDADVVKFWGMAGGNGLRQHGKNLASDVSDRRRNFRERPIIFIAHSLGGLVCEQALLYCREGEGNLEKLFQSTRGIVFMGTPHAGADLANVGYTIGTWLNVFRATNSAILETLRRNSSILIGVQQQFQQLLRKPGINIEIYCFFEEKAVTGVGVIVPEHSAVLSQYPSQSIAANHMNMAKFSSRNDGGYHRVLGRLYESMERISSLVSTETSQGPISRQLEDCEPSTSMGAGHDFAANQTFNNTGSGTAFAIGRDVHGALNFNLTVQKDLDKIVQRKKLPLSTVPFARDRDFVGREDILQDIESRLALTNSHTRIVLVGLGGVGKSQIAIEYSYRLRAKDPMVWVFWVYASSLARFRQAYKSIAAKLELPGWDDPNTDVLALVSRWLSDVDNGRWLMIVDNADDVDIFYHTHLETSIGPESSQDRAPLIEFIPQIETGAVLFTTRDRGAANRLSTGYASIVQVDIMEPVEAEQLLRISIPDGLSTSSERDKLVKELDFLPLAITQAAAYISAKATASAGERRMDVSKYLELYSKDKASQSRLLDTDAGDLRRDPNVPNSVIRTWQISFEQIKRAYPEAAALFSLMATFDRQAIPEFLLRANYTDHLDFEEALSPIERFSLIILEQGGKSFTMHRIVQLATRKWLTQYNEVEKWQGEAIKALSQTFPNGQYENWTTCEMLWPHAHEVLKSELVSKPHFINRGLVLYNMAWYNWLQGRYALAMVQSQESLVLREQVLEVSDQRIFDSIELVGLVLRYQGKYDEAETMNRRALAGCEAKLGAEHPFTLTSVSNLASVLRYQGKYDEAETMNRRALAGSEAKLGAEHPFTLTSVSNLASVLRYQGKYDEAERMNRRALAGCEAKLGAEHPSTLTSVSNLASVLQYQGKYDEAETMNRRALAGREAKLGAEHPDTLTSVSNLASVLQYQGKYDEAETINRRVLAGCEAKLGAEHPSTLTSVSNLASVLQYQGKYDEAETMNRRALAGREAKLGAEHPSTLTSVSNLASVLQYQGKYDEAETMNRRALAGREAKLGAEHPDTLTSVSNLASVLRYQGKYDEAETMSRRALAGHEAKLGAEHPFTLTSVSNLASVLRYQGKYDEAETMSRRALAGYEAKLGAEHPFTLTSVSNLALILRGQGKYDEAEMMNRRALAGRETKPRAEPRIP